jgi:hypothetical protein
MCARRLRVLDLGMFSEVRLRPVFLKWFNQILNQGWKPRQRKEVNEPILDNWNFVQVKFLSPWCKGEALPPFGRLTINRVKRG